MLRFQVTWHPKNGDALHDSEEIHVNLHLSSVGGDGGALASKWNWRLLNSADKNLHTHPLLC